MTPAEYRKLRDTELRDSPIPGRLLRAVTTGGGVTVPAGTIVSVVGKYGGLDVRAEPCSRCGVTVRVTRVAYEAVELLPEADR